MFINFVIAHHPGPLCFLARCHRSGLNHGFVATGRATAGIAITQQPIFQVFHPTCVMRFTD